MTPEYSTWEQAGNLVTYCFATCVRDHTLGYFPKAKTPKEVWENLRKIFAANTVGTEAASVETSTTILYKRSLSVQVKAKSNRTQNERERETCTNYVELYYFKW